MTEGKQDHLRCKVGLLRRVVTLCDKVRSCEIRNSLNVEPFLSAAISAILFRPCVQNVPGRVGEASPADYTHRTAAYRSTKDQAK